MVIRTLDKKAKDVPTSNGVRDLPPGTRIGGNPSSNITITEDTTMVTVEAGPVLFTKGTKIDCDHGPHEPDPCGLS